MLLQTFVKMRKNFEQEREQSHCKPKEFVRNIDIGTGFKSIDDSDDELQAAEKYSPIRAVVAADADSSFLQDIGEQSDSQLGLCDEIQSKTLSI